MFKCKKCGATFETPNYWKETHGLDFPPYEIFSKCPKCGEDFEETIRCEICGERFLEDELSGGCCDGCIDKYRKNFEMCYEISLGETQEVEINALLASLFEPRDIEQILKEYIKEKWQDIDCSSFIDEDKEWFAEKLAKEVKKNEKAKG